jgi:hypothetical protein
MFMASHPVLLRPLSRARLRHADAGSILPRWRPTVGRLPLGLCEWRRPLLLWHGKHSNRVEGDTRRSVFEPACSANVYISVNIFARAQPETLPGSWS